MYPCVLSTSARSRWYGKDMILLDMFLVVGSNGSLCTFRLALIVPHSLVYLRRHWDLSLCAVNRTGLLSQQHDKKGYSIEVLKSMDASATARQNIQSVHQLTIWGEEYMGSNEHLNIVNSLSYRSISLVYKDWRRCKVQLAFLVLKSEKHDFEGMEMRKVDLFTCRMKWEKSKAILPLDSLLTYRVLWRPCLHVPLGTGKNTF